MLFANFAEAVAEGRGKAQADTLREGANRDHRPSACCRIAPASTMRRVSTSSSARRDLKQGDIVLVEAGDLIPSDGEVIEGIASVDKSAITGESAPVIRESGGDRSAVTGGTRVLSDWIKVRITAAQGSTFLDRMIALVEGAQRQKTPNEIALNILLAGMTIIFVFAVASIPSFATYAGGAISVVVLVALFVTLIPTTIGALLSAIGIAGMDRLVRFNVLAMSGRAVEAAGDVDTLLLDKTGTITLGNRQATEFVPRRRRRASRSSPMRRNSPRFRTRRRRAARSWCWRRSTTGCAAARLARARCAFRPVLGADADQRRRHRWRLDPQGRRRCGPRLSCAPPRRLATGPCRTHRSPRSRAPAARRRCSASSRRRPSEIAKAGGTPLAVAQDDRLLGVIHLKDIVKGGIRERFAELRRWASAR